jgi:hypothetical protein
MFLSTPTGAKFTALAAWKDLNSFDLQYNLANGRIPAIKTNYPVKHIKATDAQGDYYGQIDVATNQKHGIGRLVSRTGSIIEGEWYDDRIQGWGRKISFDGGHYEGEFLNGQKNG